MSEDQLPEEFGAGLPLLEKLKLLAEWSPLLARMQAVLSAETPHARAVAVIDTLQWAAGKSGTQVDDEALEHLEAVLKSPEGQAFFNWCVNKIDGAL